MRLEELPHLSIIAQSKERAIGSSSNFDAVTFLVRILNPSWSNVSMNKSVQIQEPWVSFEVHRNFHRHSSRHNSFKFLLLSVELLDSPSQERRGCARNDPDRALCSDADIFRDSTSLLDP